MDSFSSVSKGCFYVPASKKSKKHDLKAENYLDDDDLATKTQFQMANETWKDMNQRIKRLHDDLTAKIFRNLLQFMKISSEMKFQENSGKRSEIPTAALITGVNMPDHTEIFEDLVSKVQTQITPHIALLSAKHCSNMKSLMRCIGQQLLLDESADSHNASLDDNNLDSQLSDKSTLWRKSIPFTMSILEKWYSQLDLSNEISNKHKKEHYSSSAIVFMLQDIESFSSQILHDFITMLSSWVNHLPFILVFGVSTSWSSVVDRQLPHSATVHLSLEKFHSPSASQHLALIIDEILLTSDQPFRLGGKCLQSLLDTFLCHDFSISNFLQTLKFCVLEHFYNQPASILCTASGTAALKKLEKSNPKLLKYFQSLPSVQSFLCTLTTKQNENLNKDEEELKKVLKSMLQAIRDFHFCFYPVMRSLYQLCKSLPRHPLGRQIRELYCLCSQLKITETEGYKEAKLFLQVSSRDLLIQKLRTCHTELDKIPRKIIENTSSSMFCVVGSAKSEIKSVIDNLEHLDDQQDGEDAVEESVEEVEEKPLEKVKYAYQLQEKLKTRSKQKKFRKMSKFEKLRMSALDTLHELFRKILLPPRTLPLHEVFYFDSVGSVRRHMNVAPRLAIQTALGNPYHYLKHPCLNSEVIPPNAPDVCIAYKLHNECGRLINLYDWMEAFHTIVTSTEEDDVPIGEIDETTQARFIRAVSELQFLGLVKPTKRKTDHVQRLTWSHS